MHSFSFFKKLALVFLFLFPVTVTFAEKVAVKEEGPYTVTLDSLKNAIEYLENNYEETYSSSQYFLTELDKLAQDFSQEKLDALAYRALIKENPLLNKHPLLFVLRSQYALDHHNTETLFQPGEINENKYRAGGVIKILDIPSGSVKVLFDPGAEGMARDPEVHFDAQKIIFSSRKNKQDGYHIYEINIDGTGLRQLTSLPGVSDIDPVYLPNGDIVFSSTREPKFCMCNRHIMANLYRMEADGANPLQIGKSTLFEGHSTLLPDGRILYDRWEYVDRNFGDAQGLWTSNPDGTNHVIYWGNNTSSPGGVIDARPIPGSKKILAILAACHDRPWGALAIIDRQKGLDGPVPVERTWPEEYKQHIKQGGTDQYDSPLRFVPKRYEDPFPINDKFFLASRMIDPKKYGEKTGIYLIDTFGNEILVYQEAASDKGAYDPMPIVSHPKPAMPSEQVDLSKKTGIFFLQNVYEGTHMKGVNKGDVKFLRIIESPEKRTWTKHGWGGQGEQAPAQNWHSFENKKILGVVPVNEDGSATFEIPSDCFVYFQALDSNGKMIQSMRSGTMLRPGETQSCIGCHDNRLEAPPAAMSPTMANGQRPYKMTGFKGRQKLFSYTEEVQPIWDKNCLSCHDFGKKAGEKLNLSGDLVMPFNVSYTELWNKQYTAAIGGGPAEIRPAKSWGSLCSKLVDVLEKGHNEVKLSKEDLETIYTWLDINAVYYPSYETSYPEGVFGRGPLTPGEFNKLHNIARKKLPTWHGFRGNVSYSITRPEVSPFLKNLSPDEANEALALLREAKSRLEKTPRADMKGFIPYDKKQLDKYDRLQQIADTVKKAIISGEKVYDTNFCN